MKIEDIITEWDKDGAIDATKLTEDQVAVNRLHNKYYRYYVAEGMMLRQQKNELKELTLKKGEWFRGELDKEELKQLGWQPNPLKILKQDIPQHLEADKDIQELTLKIGLQEYKVNYLESVLKSISFRGNQIKNIIEWEKFKAGSF